MDLSVSPVENEKVKVSRLSKKYSNVDYNISSPTDHSDQPRMLGRKNDKKSKKNNTNAIIEGSRKMNRPNMNNEYSVSERDKYDTEIINNDSDDIFEKAERAYSKSSGSNYMSRSSNKEKQYESPKQSRSIKRITKRNGDDNIRVEYSGGASSSNSDSTDSKPVITESKNSKDSEQFANMLKRSEKNTRDNRNNGREIYKDNTSVERAKKNTSSDDSESVNSDTSVLTFSSDEEDMKIKPQLPAVATKIDISGGNDMLSKLPNGYNGELPEEFRYGLNMGSGMSGGNQYNSLYSALQPSNAANNIYQPQQMMPPMQQMQQMPFMDNLPQLPKLPPQTNIMPDNMVGNNMIPNHIMQNNMTPNNAMYNNAFSSGMMSANMMGGNNTNNIGSAGFRGNDLNKLPPLPFPSEGNMNSRIAQMPNQQMNLQNGQTKNGDFFF